MPAADIFRRFLTNLSGRGVRSAKELMRRNPAAAGGIGPQLPTGIDIANLRAARTNAWANLLGGTALAGVGGYAANEALHPMDLAGSAFHKLMGTNVGNLVDRAGHGVGKALKLPGRFFHAIGDEIGINTPELTPAPPSKFMTSLKSITPTQIGLGLAGAGLAGAAGYGAYKALASGDEDEADGDYPNLRKTAHVITPAYVEEFARTCREAGMDKQAAAVLLRSAVEARSPVWAVKAASQRQIGLDPVWAGIVTFKLATAP